MVLQNSFNQRLVDGLTVQLTGSATGDLWYRDVNGFFTRLPIGTNGQILTVSAGGIPFWASGVSPGGAAGGDLTGNFPNPTIAANAVTYGKIQNVSASQRLLGRATAGAGVIEELTVAQARSLLGLGTAALLDVGTGANQVLQLDSSGFIPTSVVPALALNTIQVVANQAARLALSNVQPGDIAKQTDNGLSYMLSALPASTDGNWVTIGDTTIDAADIVSGTIATARLGSGTANSGSFLRGDQTWQPIPFVPVPANTVSGTTQALAINNRYYPNNAGLCTLTLPATAAIGSLIQIRGQGAGGWRIAQNSGQQIHFGNQSSTVGLTGQLNSTHRRDCVDLECVVANNEWTVSSAIGNIDVV